MDPQIKTVEEIDELYKFTLAGINVSIANSLRRTIINDIPTVVIRTENYNDNQCKFIKNTTRLHNEILKQRLSCIPIHMQLDELDLLPNNYELVVDVKNDDDKTMYVTTEHFKIRKKDGGKYLSPAEHLRIFPPSKQNYFIDFARLRPKISDSIPGDELSFIADFSISTAKTNSMFNVVSKCAYGNSPDLEKINKVWQEKESKLKSEDVSQEDISFQKKNFYILDAQQIYLKDSFDFVIQSVGVYENKTIVKTAAQILFEKFDNFNNFIDSDIVDILNSDTTMSNCYDIHLKDEDYTIGKVLEFILYAKYYEEEKKLTFCGFKKFHPHDNYSVIRIAFKQQSDKSMAKQLLKNASTEAVNIFKKIHKIV